MSSATLTQTHSSKQFAEISYQIAHSTKGRIRLRIPQIAKDLEYAQRLLRSIQAIPFVTEVIINPKAMSVTIQYNAHQVSSTTIKEQLENAIRRSIAPEIAPHSTSSLAKRLGVAVQSLNWHRSQIDFADWSRDRDPEGVSWRYDSASKSFSPIEYGSSSIAPLVPQSPILQALSGAASVKVGGMVGKVAGEVLGLVLLGSAGVVIGAEVGAFIGEVIGAEVGNI